MRKWMAATLITAMVLLGGQSAVMMPHAFVGLPVGMTDVSGWTLLTVPCHIDGFWWGGDFLCGIDTGLSFQMIVPASIPRVLHLQPEGTTKVSTFNGQTVVEEYSLPVRFGDSTVTVDAIVSPGYSGIPLVGLPLFKKLGGTVNFVQAQSSQES